MVRRSALLAVAALAAAALLLVPAPAGAVTAPTAAPVLTSAPYTLPVALHWTPGSDPLNASQSVYRAAGACTTPLTEGDLVRTFAGNATTDISTSPSDGVYCFYVKTADALAATANSPGVTVRVDTMDPTATVAVGAGPGGAVTGTVSVSGTSADAVSGVASSVLHVGAPGACASGPVVGASWDSTTVPNGAYDVCNVVADNAGHVAVATAGVTVANVAPPAPAPPAAGQPVPTTTGTHDKTPPAAPVRLRIALPRAKPGATRVPVRLRWTLPAADDLASVTVVVNAKHAPKRPSDGTKVLSALRSSAVLQLRPGEVVNVAVFAYDRAGNVSKPGRRVVSLASMIPLRPLTGSVLTAPPHLSWRPTQGTAYYNVQVFRNGRRVLVAWPTRAAYDIPSLAPGSYVWFVWPAVRAEDGTRTFGQLIGRATFVVKSV